MLGTAPDSIDHAQLVRQWSDDVIFFTHICAATASERAALEARGIRVIDGLVAAFSVVDDRLDAVQLADGREVQAKLVKIPQVRVGKFIVENVECAVMPENLTNASAILGMSFLRNFSFKIETDTGKLTMSKVDGPTTGAPAKPK